MIRSVIAGSALFSALVLSPLLTVLSIKSDYNFTGVIIAMVGIMSLFVGIRETIVLSRGEE